MILILVRHGETLENVEGRIQGHSHGCLSPMGLIQAMQVSTVLETKKIDAVFSSDLNRAKDTATAILQKHKNVPITYTSLLRERGYGLFEGKYKKSVLFSNDLMHLNSHEIESLDSLYERCCTFLCSILEDYPNKCVLVITHNGFIRMFFTFLLGKECNQVTEMGNFGNVSISEVEFITINNFKTLCFNLLPNKNRQ